MAKMVKPVKMSDIARELNISTVTVSKALSGNKGVSELTREKVKRLADQLGYQYASAGRADQRSYNIGVVISKRYLDSVDTFYWKMYQEVTGKALKNGCFTLLEILKEEDEIEKSVPKLVLEEKVDGLIIVGKPGHEYAAMLENTVKKPMVFLDFYDAELSTDAVVSNSYMGAYMLTKYLIRKGHRRIGYVGTLLVTDSVTDRYLGYVRALMEHHIPVEQELIIGDRDLETGLNCQICLPEEMPTAFVCNCDYIASIVIRTIRERGWRVPEDVSVVGFDNFLYPGLCDIGITTYEVDIQKMAGMAVDMLIRKMAGETAEFGVSIVDGRMLEKESVREADAIDDRVRIAE